MPIDSFKYNLKKSQSHNQKVHQQLKELNALVHQCHSREQLLAALSEMKNAPLQFNNRWINYIVCINLILLVLFVVLPKFNFLILLLILSLSFLAYIYYENDEPIQHCVNRLERFVIQHQYNLNYSNLPLSIAHYNRNGMALTVLKQRFNPLFEQGSFANTFTDYASSVWVDEQGKSYSVLVFEYEYVQSSATSDYLPHDVNMWIEIFEALQNIFKKNRHQHRKYEHLWGVFVFDVDLNGFAIATENKYFPQDYIAQWKTSDIQMNRNMYIRGESELHLAQTITSHRALLLNQIFTQRKGYLHCHADMSVMCFLGKKPILQMPKVDVKQFDDLARLRGYLRRLKLAEYERLQHDLLDFLSHSPDIFHES